VTAETSVREARITLHRLGPDDYRRQVLLDWAGSDQAPTDANWRKLLALPDVAPVPLFPISGRDLVALGLPQGPKVGELKRTLESRWIKDDFAPDRDALLALAHKLIAEGTAR